MARQNFFQVCGSEIYCKCGIYSISTVILGRSYLSETHNWMRMLDSEPQFLMARSAMQNVFWAIPCTPSKDTKVPLKANWRMYIMWLWLSKRNIMYSTQHSLTIWFSLMERAVTTRNKQSKNCSYKKFIVRYRNIALAPESHQQKRSSKSSGPYSVWSV